jgi:hypothetical protein
MSRTKRIVAIVVTVYLLLVFLEEFALVGGLAQRLAVPLLLALLDALAAIGMGFMARGLRGRVGRFDDETARPDPALDLLIGVPLFGTTCFLVGTIHIASWTMIPLLVVFGLAGAYAVARYFESRTGATPTVLTPADRFALVAIAIIFLCALVAAQTPPSTLDELAYHLAVPWTWVKEGRTIELPLVSHSYFPLGVESASLPLLTILGNVAGGLSSHLLHLLIALAATIVIARRTGNLLLTAAIVATPALAVTAGWSLVDWAMAGLAIALSAAIDDGDEAASAALLGAGLLTKYTFVPIAALLLLAGFRKLAPAARWRVVAIGLAIGSVFFVRNMILTGNPVAPFLSANAPHVAGYRSPVYLSSYVFDGHYIDESLGASLIGVAVATTGAAGWLMLAAGFGLMFLAPSARILVPFFAVAASRVRILSASRTLRLVLAATIAGQVMLGVYVIESTDSFSLIATPASEAEYLTRMRASFKPLRALDAELPPDSRTLVIGLSETYWFDHQVRGGGNFDGPRISRYLEAPTAEVLYGRLKRDGITHVAIMTIASPTSVAKKVEEREMALSVEAKRALAFTLDHYAVNVSAPGSSSTLFALR